MACSDVTVRVGWCNNIVNCAYDFWEEPSRITVVNCTTINANAGGDQANIATGTPQTIRALAFQYGVSYAIAGAGTNAATALVLTKPFNYVNGGAANSGVILPQNTGNRAGEEWIIWNQSGGNIIVYPFSGDTIGGAASVNVATATKVRLVAVTGTLWLVA